MTSNSRINQIWACANSFYESSSEYCDRVTLIIRGPIHDASRETSVQKPHGVNV